VISRKGITKLDNPNTITKTKKKESNITQAHAKENKGAEKSNVT